MFAAINHRGKEYKLDLSRPIDISIPISSSSARAWYVDPVKIEPVRSGDWVGEVKSGGSVNFRNIAFNPHGHGTHTECVGHIAPEIYSVNEHLRQFFFIAELVTVLPEQRDNGDFVITARQLEILLEDKAPEAIIIRTISNAEAKRTQNWSDTNPPYLEEAAAQLIAARKIDHLLIDLPSVDRESDEGKLLAHRAFWEYPDRTQFQRTITEFIYVPNDVFDGMYLLNLQVAPFENDASPSRPVLFRVVN